MKHKRKKKLFTISLYTFLLSVLFCNSSISYGQAIQVIFDTHQNGYNHPSSPGFTQDKLIVVCENSILYLKANYPFLSAGAYKPNQSYNVYWTKYDISGDTIGTVIKLASLTQPNIGDKNGDTITLASPTTSPASFYIKVQLAHLESIDAYRDYYYWIKVVYNIQNPLPPVVTVTTEQPILFGSMATLQAAPPLPGVGLTWYSSNLIEQSKNNPFITGPLKQDTIFYVRSSIISGQVTCFSDFVSIPISVRSSLYIPNAFTPNNDGKNDLFLVYGSLVNGNEIKDIKLNIYNSWGALIFQSNDQTKGWDGKVGGVAQPRGVYIYTLTATLRRTNEKITRRGSLLLIR